MTIYERIRDLRIAQGMSQEDLAHKMGYKDRSMITKIEGGNVDISQTKIVAFANALSTSPAYLMGWIEDPSPRSDVKADDLTSDEQFVVDTYRTLSEPGKQYIHQQLTIASHMFGGKHEDVDQANPG